MKKLLIRKLNSKGAVSIFLVMAVLTAVLAIALGSSFVVSTEIKSTLDSSESVSAYYAAESGLEEALYDKVRLRREPRGKRCVGNCPPNMADPACIGWTTCNEVSLSPSEPYCIEVIETSSTKCEPDTITKINTIGEYRTTRRSIEIDFNP